MDGAAVYRVSRAAQLKILLHAARYPFAAVDGVLIGTAEGGEIAVTDAIPFSHSVVLAPVLETGMALVGAYCESDQTAKGSRIVGWYHAPASSKADGIAKPVVQIANTIRAKSEDIGACLITLNGSKLSDPTATGLEVLVRKSSGSWAPAPSASFEGEGISQEFTELLSKKVEQRIDDLESWLEDTSLDWRNLALLA